MRRVAGLRIGDASSSLSEFRRSISSGTPRCDRAFASLVDAGEARRRTKPIGAFDAFGAARGLSLVPS